MSLPLLHAGKSAPGLSAALDLRFALDKSLTAYRGPTPSFSRASTGTYFNSSGVLTSAAINAPRFNHTFNGTSWVSRGLLVEEQRTNILLQSGFASGWGTSSGTLAQASDISSLDGTNNAYKFTDAITNTNHGFYQNIPVSSGSTYSTSIYLKYGNHRYVRISFVVNGGVDSVYVDVDLLNGTIVNSGPYGSATQSSQSISNAGNGWYRVSITGTLPGTSVYLAIYHRSSSSNSNPENTFAYTGNGEFTYFFAPQVEAGSFSTSYIPTTSSAVTRSADVCQITGSDFSGLWNGTEGSFATEYDGQRGNAYIFATHNGGGGWQNSINLRRTNSDDLNQIFTSGVGQAGNSITGPANGVSVKNAFAFKLDDYASSFNGLSVVTDNSCTLPTVSRMDIGYSSAEVAPFNGHIARLRYFNKRLPNATLQLLSEPDPTLNLQFALNKSLTPVAGPAPSFSRASTGTYFNASGVLTSASINTPRFDHVYSGGQWVSKGLLVEEQRTNLALWSEDLSNGYWTKTNCSITADAIVSPDGNSNADLAEFSASGTAPRVFQTQSFSVTSGTSYTKSFFVKAGTQRWIQIVWSGGAHSARFANFDTLTMTFGTVSANVTTSVANVGNGWYRVSATSAATATALDLFWIYAVDSGTSGWASNSTSGGSVYVFGFQHEAGSFPTSYTGTTSSSVTRSADVCQITGTSFNWMWNQGEGSVAFEAGTFSDSSYLGRYLEFTRTSSVGSPSIGVGTINSAGSAGGDNVYNYVWDSSTQAALYASPARPLAKSSFAWKVNDFAASINGATALTDTSGTVPTGIDVLTIGSRYGSLNIINGHIAKLIYYPARLTNTKLQQLST